ncbi:MAG TPA: magnesium chelatase subunit D family protein [Anaerolineales bacterium]
MAVYRSVVYPFTAIVGQERMGRALVLNAVNPRIGGVLIRGERGTAKSTAARALAALLPEVRVVADCRFACDPDQPTSWCTECKERVARGEQLPVELRRTPFVDLPVSATEDRVVGTLDIERAIKEGERHFEPGVLAAANRGLLYIDEVNLLDDHVVDVLLDSAALGMNIVEREGISFSHPARYILVGTMNPEEGDLRPQLLDRFALSVEIHGLHEPEDRVAIMERNLAFEDDPKGFRGVWMPQEQQLSREIEAARALLDKVTYNRKDLLSIAALTSSLEVDGHRADLVILKAARAHAALAGREAIQERDIALAAELALPHRLKRGPLQQAQIKLEDLQHRIEQIQTQFAGADDQEPVPAEEIPSGKKKGRQGVEHDAPEPTQDTGHAQPGRQAYPESLTARWWEGGDRVKVGETFVPRRLANPIDRVTRRQSGRRTQTRTDRKRGRYVSARPASERNPDIAFDATLRAAAPHQRRRAGQRTRVALAIESTDLQAKVRVRKAANLILFVVDASWSMAVAERMSATKGAILSLLTDAYQRRDRVGLIVFQKDRALTVLPPTSSVLLAQHSLADIPVGGKTPLSAGLRLALEVFEHEKINHPDVLPLMILLTDGAGNVSMGDLPPQEEALRIADQIHEGDIRAVVINMEHAAFDQGLARTLADRLGSPCYTLHELKAEHLYRAVRKELDAAGTSP